jgi:sulfopyruvate decarboxylase TPP-binding subunit
MELKELLIKQAEYDSKYWEHRGSELEAIRHITLHLGKALGKLATYCEAREHNRDCSTEQIKREVIPDLMIYALQLSNLLGVKIDQEYVNRLDRNSRSFLSGRTERIGLQR